MNASLTRCLRLICTGSAFGLLLASGASANASQLASVGTVRIQSSAAIAVIDAPVARLEFSRAGLISRFGASAGRDFRLEPSGFAFLTAEAVGSSPFNTPESYSGVGETSAKDSLAITVTKKTEGGETRSQKITSVLAHFY